MRLPPTLGKRLSRSTIAQAFLAASSTSRATPASCRSSKPTFRACESKPSFFEGRGTRSSPSRMRASSPPRCPMPPCRSSTTPAILLTKTPRTPSPTQCAPGSSARRHGHRCPSPSPTHPGNAEAVACTGAWPLQQVVPYGCALHSNSGRTRLHVSHDVRVSPWSVNFGGFSWFLLFHRATFGSNQTSVM